jgi:hypothetical protein
VTGRPDVRRPGHRLFDQVARLAAAQVDASRLQIAGDEPLDEIRLTGDAVFAAVAVEDPAVGLDRRALRQDLVADAAEERLVHQLGRLHVGGEHHQAVERDVELEARGQRQVIDAALERHDPAVEQIAR